jgi:predicted dehydrogenase/uncharacterized radical SAM superfamily Fe-S cluster-containing enzyme
VFSIDGNPGCPYQADARSNPIYRDVVLPDGVGRGCGFCTTGNHYQARPHDDTIARVFEQLAYVRREAPEVTVLVLRDQNPMGYLTELLQQCAEHQVGGFVLMLQTRADWLLQGQRRFRLALDAAARAGITITPFLVGIESFAQAELDRMNKGITVADNRAFLAALSTWSSHPAFDLSRASFGYILFTPWTTMADLQQSYDGIAATGFDRLRGKLLHARVRLYPDTAMFYLAQRDGLLHDEGAASTLPGRYGYFPDRSWRFADPVVAQFAELAAAASTATNGRDELRLFRDLLRAFAERPAAAIDLAALVAGGSTTARTAVAPAVGGTSRRSIEVDLGGRCRPECAVCRPPAPTADVERVLRAGAARIVVRGAGPEPSAMRQRIGDARGRDVVRAGHVDTIDSVAAAQAWVDAGVRTVLVPIVSHVVAVHDRAVGRPGDLVATLVAVRALAQVGVAIELEVPIVAARLQDLAAIIALFVRAIPALRAVRCYLPRHAMPRALTPPPLDEIAPRLVAAHEVAARHGVKLPLDVTAAIPLCGLVSSETLRSLVRFDPRRPTRVNGCEKIAACRECAIALQCAGVPASYLAGHGAAHIHPVAQRPNDLYAQRTTPRRRWDDDARSAARQAGLLVLRPTVHCNQDCGFCSANESTPNVWADPDRMVRAIARAARRGVERVSFSGGEPTLARELPRYIAVARRAGVRKVELVTNGVLLDREARVRELVDAGLTHAFVSLHGHDENLASAATRKVGDFVRTTAAIEHLVAAGVITVINHVITANNMAYLTQFVDEMFVRYHGRAMISFAFVTPQYQALDNIELVPRLSEAAPHLHRAAWRALELRQPFVIGSRQGVPPCFLGPFAAWSDLLQLAHESKAEDQPQKQTGPRCGECRYATYCTGLWKPYAARFGFDELQPVPGPRLGDVERTALLTHARRPPWGQPMSFADAPMLLRDQAAERAGPSTVTPPTATRAALVVHGARPLRLLMIGSGRRARDLARGALAAGGFAFTAVCSPHADLAERTAFEGCSAFTDLEAALASTRPDAVVIASATPSHAAVATTAIEFGAPILIEKPLATSESVAAQLVALAHRGGVVVMPAHSELFAPGLERVFTASAGSALAITRRTTRAAPDAPGSWSRPSLYESLYHLLVLAHRHAGSDLVVGDVRWRGDARPELVQLELVQPGGAAVTVHWHLDDAVDGLAIRSETAHWHRRGAEVALTVGGVASSCERDGSDVTRMFRRFHSVVRGGPVPVVADSAVEVMALTRAVLDGLAAAGAPLSRPGAPRHAASPELARRYRK